MDQVERRRFPSKRDAWLSVVIWAASLVCLASVGSLLAKEGNLLARLGVGALLSAATALMLWILYGTHYTFSEGRLDIRCGPFQFQLPLADVVSVEPTRNPLSSPACSLHRLLIRHGRSRIMVSPESRGEFLDVLVKQAPHLTRHGDRVASSASIATSPRGS